MSGRTDWTAHVILTLGVLLFLLPLWLVFSASTQDAAMIGRGEPVPGEALARPEAQAVLQEQGA